MRCPGNSSLALPPKPSMCGQLPHLVGTIVQLGLCAFWGKKVLQHQNIPFCSHGNFLKKYEPMSSRFATQTTPLCYLSVSYTHLDVYKRQGLGCGTCVCYDLVVSELISINA